MSFFAIMFSFSKVDTAAFDAVRKSVAKQFGGVIGMPFESLNAKLQEVIKKRNLEESVRTEQNGNSISVIFQGSTLFETGSTELGEVGKERISEFLDILREQAFQFPIIVEGHTDDSPISSDKFPSNWELSGARASLILRMLDAKGFKRDQLQAQGFADTRPVAPNRTEKGEIISENQALNRRITLKILKELPAQ